MICHSSHIFTLQSLLSPHFQPSFPKRNLRNRQCNFGRDVQYKTYCKGQDTLPMFVSELSSLEHFSPPLSPSHSSLTLHNSALEFQYQLCQIFMNKTGEQLHRKETQLMLESQNFIKSLISKDGQKDLCSSTDSGSQEIIPSPQEDSTNSHFSGVKRTDGLLWRKIQAKLAPSLAEVEESCSVLCVANLRATIADYRNLVQRWWEVQAKESIMERKKLHYQREHQENLILKQKLSSLNLKIQTMQCEIDCLKEKSRTVLDYANQRLQEMLGNQKLIEINSKVYRDIKSYLEDKQKNAVNRLTRAQSLQTHLIEQISQLLPPGSCENCCNMLRKVKDSLIKFKRYLESEGSELESLYNKYKKTLFSQKSHKHF